jgi:hypothetical protein
VSHFDFKEPEESSFLPHDGRRGDLVVERLSVKMEIGGEDLASMLLTFYLRRRRCGEIS